jgi:hypothetical protein
LSVSDNILAQGRGNIWCFADSVLLDFNDVVPIVGTCSLISSVENQNSEPSASISDENGNLLFYTNGSTIWNIDHDTMENGNNLPSNYSITQGALIIPRPDSADQYYVFGFDHDIPDYGFYYSIVDMSLDSGKGAIPEGCKNIQLLNILLSEKLTAVKHANGKDWWLIIHKLGTAQFFKYLINSSGIILNDIQSIGSDFNNSIDQGELIFSQEGNKLISASTSGTIALFDFDRCSGVLSNYVDLTDKPMTEGCYGCSFSSDGSKLYLSNFENLFQYNLDATYIPNSRISLWNNPLYHPNCLDSSFVMYQHLLGRDDRIYIVNSYCVHPNEVYSIYNMTMSVINDPNEEGTLCNFVPWSLYLGGKKTVGGLTNMPNYNLEALEGSPCDTVTSVVPLNTDNEVKIYPNPAKDDATVNYNLKGEQGRLVLYNVFGAKIADYTLDPLSSQMQISVSNLPSGVYLYSMESDNVSFSHGKIIILN